MRNKNVCRVGVDPQYCWDLWWQ